MTSDFAETNRFTESLVTGHLTHFFIGHEESPQ